MRYKAGGTICNAAGSAGGMMGGTGMGPGGMDRPERPDGFEPPAQGQQPPQNVAPQEGFTPPQGGTPPEGFTPPQGENPPEMPGGNTPGNPAGSNTGNLKLTTDFEIRDGGNMFRGITVK